MTILSIAIYSATPTTKNCGIQCKFIRCAAPLCAEDEILRNGDGICECCPRCVKEDVSSLERDSEECTRYSCAVVNCLPQFKESCRPNQKFVPPDGQCNCCGKCVTILKYY